MSERILSGPTQLSKMRSAHSLPPFMIGAYVSTQMGWMYADASSASSGERIWMSMAL